MDDATQVGRATAEAFAVGLGRQSVIPDGPPTRSGLPSEGSSTAPPTTPKGQVLAMLHDDPGTLYRLLNDGS